MTLASSVTQQHRKKNTTAIEEMQKQTKQTHGHGRHNIEKQTGETK
jgi:hypothetical protein